MFEGVREDDFPDTSAIIQAVLRIVECLVMPAAEQVSGMSRKLGQSSFSCRILESSARNKTSA